MNDIEERLRTRLHDLAETVPSTPHARADLERRLAHRRRRPLLVAAAVIAVVAAVVVPVVLSKNGDPIGGSATIAPPTTNANGYYVGPVVIGEFTRDGERWQEILTVKPGDDGHEWMCTGQIAPSQPDPAVSSCGEVPLNWPEEPYNGQLEGMKGWVSGGYSLTADLPNQWLIMAAPQVATLEVRREDGSWVPADLVAETAHGRFFVARIEGGLESFRGYTAKNATGKVLERVLM